MPFGGHQHRLDVREVPVTIDELQLMAGSLTTLISRHWQYRPSRCYARDGRALNKEKGVAVCRCAGLSQFRLEKSFASWICQFMSSRWRPCGQAARENFSQLRPLTFSPPFDRNEPLRLQKGCENDPCFQIKQGSSAFGTRGFLSH
jgi:hypothetical protein